MRDTRCAKVSISSKSVQILANVLMPECSDVSSGLDQGVDDNDNDDLDVSTGADDNDDDDNLDVSAGADENDNNDLDVSAGAGWGVVPVRG